MVYIVETKAETVEVLLSISDVIYFIRKQYFPEEIKNILFEILLLKTKLIVLGITYR